MKLTLDFLSKYLKFQESFAVVASLFFISFGVNREKIQTVIKFGRGSF